MARHNYLELPRLGDRERPCHQSDLRAYDACPQRYILGRVAERLALDDQVMPQSPPNHSGVRGTAIHSLIERYLHRAKPEDDAYDLAVWAMDIYPSLLAGSMRGGELTATMITKSRKDAEWCKVVIESLHRLIGPRPGCRGSYEMDYRPSAEYPHGMTIRWEFGQPWELVSTEAKFNAASWRPHKHMPPRYYGGIVDVIWLGGTDRIITTEGGRETVITVPPGYRVWDWKSGTNKAPQRALDWDYQVAGIYPMAVEGGYIHGVKPMPVVHRAIVYLDDLKPYATSGGKHGHQGQLKGRAIYPVSHLITHDDVMRRRTHPRLTEIRSRELDKDAWVDFADDLKMCAICNHRPVCAAGIDARVSPEAFLAEIKRSVR